MRSDSWRGAPPSGENDRNETIAKPLRDRRRRGTADAARRQHRALSRYL